MALAPLRPYLLIWTVVFRAMPGLLEKMLERFRHVDKTWGSLECEVGCFEC